MVFRGPKNLFVVAIVAGSFAVSGAPSQGLSQDQDADDSATDSPVQARVSHYVSGSTSQSGDPISRARNPLVVLELVKSHSIAAGDILNTRRPSSAPGGTVVDGPEIEVNTGRVKVLRISNSTAVGSVLEDGNEMSRQFFPKFPGVMAGDLLVREPTLIEANLVLSPTVTLYYDRIFADPNPGAHTFEMSEPGRQVLAESVRSLSESRLSRIIVEGYTDTRGASELNQIESLQRALTVRQYMIVSLGFDPDRIVAIGLGEGEPVAGPRVPDSARLNRRIIVKALPVSPSP